MAPSSAVHGDQHETKCVTFELLMHAAFVADEIWGDMLEPARRITLSIALFAARSHVKTMDRSSIPDVQ